MLIVVLYIYREALLGGLSLALLLTEAHKGDLGVGEAGGWDSVMVHYMRLADDVLYR